MRPRAKRGAQTKERCVMGRGHTAKLLGAAVALTASISGSQGQIALPPVDVNWTRLNSGMVGTSTSIITSQDIESSPAQNLPDILSQQVGIQVQHLLSSTNGSRDAVDLRGFGAFAQSNVLMLVNGRRCHQYRPQKRVIAGRHQSRGGFWRLVPILGGACIGGSDERAMVGWRVWK